MTINTETIMAACAFIIALGGAGTVVYKMTKPLMELKKEIKSHEKAIKDLQEKSVRDYKALGEIREMSALQTKCAIDMMNHMIDGNHTEAMKRTRDEAIDLLAKQ